MELHKKTFTTELNKEPITIEVSDLAGQANAAVIGRHGNTAVLATVVMSKEDRMGDFFPLTVDYEERFYAAGKIIGSRFVRREGRASDEAILSSRLIDRTVRPLFDARLRREVQIVVTVLSYDEKNDPDVIGLLSASTALAISDIPWNGPIAGVQIVKKNDKGEEYRSFFAGPEAYVNMIEFEGKEIQESAALEAFSTAHEKIKQLITFQKKIVSEIGKKKADVMLKKPDEEIEGLVKKFIEGKIGPALCNKTFSELKNDLFKHLASLEKTGDTLKDVEQILETETDKFVHEEILKHDRRVDGRKLNEIRPLYGEVGLLELTHGSGLFVRGQTQVLAVTTLASSSAEQLVETMESTTKKSFMLHYNFPSFSTGEVGRSSRGPGRREIGHGALAAKALRALIPTKEEFPYTIRIVAETLSSNGSSSMASTCAGCLSLMDAGVPIKKHIGGVAMGLMTSEDGKEYKILTDIQGPEDHYGDMDFKVAGTKDGITAIQMDVKINGITAEIFERALTQAKEGRLSIIGVMEKVIPAARQNVSKYAPKIMSLMIPQDRIGELIGPGGKNINGIVAASENKITVDIEETGKVYVAGVDITLVERAYNTIKASMREFSIGEIVTGPIVRILEFGAIVDLGGGQDGMIHVSELKEGFVKKVEDVVHIGDVVKAKIIKINEGKIGLSLKGLGDKK